MSRFRVAQGLNASDKRGCIIKKGVNPYKGKLTYKAVADALDLDYTPLEL